MDATTLREMTTEISPANLTELRAMRLGDFGYDDVQAAARVTIRSGNVGFYIAAVSKWIAEKP